MPFIEVKTTEDLSAVAAELKSALGDAITAIPGKSESWLMVNLVGEQKMYFQGSDTPCALFSVSVFGTATDDAYDDLTAGCAPLPSSICRCRRSVPMCATERWITGATTTLISEHEALRATAALLLG